MTEPQTPDETRWLIAYTSAGPRWVAGFETERARVSPTCYSASLTPIETFDPNEALAFCRERDARALLSVMRYRAILRVEEHIWLDVHRSTDCATEGR